MYWVGNMTQMMKKKEMTPPQLLVVGFTAMIFLGAILLSLPISSIKAVPLSFLEALFTSTSAVCVTGLSIFDPGSTLSMFGQVVLITLIQLGGLGFMTMTTLTYRMIRRRSTLKDRVHIMDSFNETRLSGMISLTKYAAIITGLAELAGALLFAIRFIPMYGLERGLFYSIFQSISSFCNAGFDVYGLGNSLAPFRNDPLVTITTMALITLGGLGFFVIAELYGKLIKRTHKKLSLHTRLTLILSGSLVLGGFLIFFISEINNPRTLGAPGIQPQEQVLGAFFQSVTARTAGFYTTPQDMLMPLSKAVTSGLMFIGAAPGGAAGGIKVTTTLTVILFIISIVRGREDVEIAHKRINRQLVLRSVAIFTIGIVVVLFMSAIIAVIEHENIALRDIVFEVTSAFGTVGLSVGITSMFSPVSYVLLILIMLGGRVGILTFTMALARRLAQNKVNIKYPEDKIIIG